MLQGSGNAMVETQERLQREDAANAKMPRRVIGIYTVRIEYNADNEDGMPEALSDAIREGNVEVLNVVDEDVEILREEQEDDD